MGSKFQVLFGPKPADDNFYNVLSSLEVEENADLPGAVQINLPVDRSPNCELTYVNDERLRPLARIAVVVTLDGAPPACIFDGFVLSHKLHLQNGVTASTLQVWGQDFSWAMNLTEKVKEWVDADDAQIAEAIFNVYGIRPDGANAKDASPLHPETGRTLMQRTTDIQFLRSLARRDGKLCRVTCTDQPGRPVGVFARPALDGKPAVTLTINSTDAWTVDVLDFEWDVTRPSAVEARQALFADPDPDGAAGDSRDSGLALLDARGLAAFAGQAMSVRLTAPVDDAGDLALRAQALLRESGWFVRCEGEADLSRLNAVLRAGTIVQIDGAGSLNSGKYLVWSVRHTIDAQSHKMRFVLLRNAVGPAVPGTTKVC